jgi:carbonic anhydrase
MKTIFKTILMCNAFLFVSISGAVEPHLGNSSALTTVHKALTNLIRDNNAFSHTKHTEEYLALSKDQTPRATMVLCADSRVHTHSFDKTPENDLFIVRNIGNQLKTAEGSIEYGIDHLHTPLLIFVGHSKCGAVKAATGDYSTLSPAIQRELQTIKLVKGIPLMEGTLTNVHQQVEQSMEKFKKLIAQNKLVIVGAIYDFSNELGHGFGKLVLINVNGEKDISKIKELEILKGIKGVHIGLKYMS